MKRDNAASISTPFLNQLSDEQLRQLLLAQMDAEELDVELIRSITSALARREEYDADDLGSSDNKIIDDYAQVYPLGPSLFPDGYERDANNHEEKTKISYEKKRPKRLYRTALAIVASVAVLFGTTVITGAHGVDFWGSIVHWTAEVFGITQGLPGEKTIHQEQDDAFEHLRLLLIKHGISQQVVPNYIPEGYILVDTREENTYEGTYYLCVLQSESNEILLRYLLIDSVLQEKYYPVDDSAPEIYTVQGIDHYILTNESTYVAYWANGQLMCTISRVPEREELYKMINSIYTEDK